MTFHEENSLLLTVGHVTYECTVDVLGTKSARSWNRYSLHAEIQTDGQTRPDT